MRRLTKIICTLGPTAKTPAQVEALARGGMNVARINLSHGSWEEHRATIRLVKALNKKLAAEGKLPSCVGILLDTKGAEVRTGNVTTPLKVKKGELVVFSPKPLPKEKKKVVIVDYKGFARDAKAADQILLDNGKITFQFVSANRDGSVVARAKQDGSIGSRRHVNLPGANLDMPSLTKDDWISIAVGAEEGVDFLGLSFIRKASEIHDVRDWLKKKKKHVSLVAKIETRQGVDNLQDIIDVSDAMMVARGDLGAEIPFEQVPVVQDVMVSLSRKAGIPVIVATHMLESMVENPIPTRAEVTDIAHAATTSTDVTMLSGETASGAHPLLALDAMDRVLRETENHLSKSRKMLHAEIRNERDAQAQSAVTFGLSSHAAAIVVMTRSGQTAREIARFRPHLPIIALTPDPQVQRALQLSFGVFPLVVPFSADPERTVKESMAKIKKAGLLKKGEKFVLVTDMKSHSESHSTMQVRIA
ncbi:pyruvate kinase [Candidatus Peribacteria bacterium]|nr:pyruvate kinase [Candidatus Peribacteria bacterium]